jgi:DNA-binding LytR/AlgR family response regulator
MKKNKAVIADDEAHLRTYLKSQLALVWPDLDICGEAQNGREAIKLIEKTHPDVIFLDIRMPGLTGIDVAKKISDSCHIVFVTAYDEYAVEAFENEAIDYLLKPVTRERLENTAKRLKQRIESENRNYGDLEKILKKIHEITGDRTPADSLQWIRAQKGKDIQLISVDDVRCFKSQDKYTIVITDKGESLIRKSIKELDQELNQEKFWLINRGVIINVACIDRVSRSMTGRFQVRLKDYPEVFTVSRSYSHLFKQM